MNCYCETGKEFEKCCQPFIEGVAKPLTALELMRSRYTAYVIVAVEYILRSTHPSSRRFYNAEDIEQWSKSSHWQKLEIVSTSEGSPKDKKGIVEFKAYYTDAEGNQQIHQEKSNFRKELGKWFFVDGKVF
ncbi:MAG TPA: YchJ family metal-binding protein [Pyrinomonadaceae bacterium]|nr:YchJ family metal-binding protein [Pyrinomonadaceae bacterium]